MVLVTCQCAVQGSTTTYTRDPSQVIKTVQLKPRMERKPNRRCILVNNVFDQGEEVHTFRTAFLPSLASARSSCLSLDRGLTTLSSGSVPLVGDDAIVSRIRDGTATRQQSTKEPVRRTDDGRKEGENYQQDKEGKTKRYAVRNK
jgi:hypothetical protein